MKRQTAYNHKRRLANRMRSIYNQAIYDRPLHRDLIARVRAEVWGDPGLKRCPSWVHTALLEVREQCADAIYRHMVWAFVGSDGVPRQLDSLPESDRQAVFKGTIQGHHYWVRSDRKVETLPDGRIVETIVKTPTLATYG